jgi:DNA-binding response OmpR family regulator
MSRRTAGLSHRRREPQLWERLSRSRTRSGNWKLHEASDCGKALALLPTKMFRCSSASPTTPTAIGKTFLNAPARLSAPPNLIAFSRLADEPLWAKVLNLGGFDVLMTPFEPEEVLRVAFAAWSRWECDSVASTAKEATRTGRPEAVKAAPPEEDWLRAEREIRTRSSAARISPRTERGSMPACWRTKAGLA